MIDPRRVRAGDRGQRSCFNSLRALQGGAWSSSREGGGKSREEGGGPPPSAPPTLSSLWPSDPSDLTTATSCPLSLAEGAFGCSEQGSVLVPPQVPGALAQPCIQHTGSWRPYTERTAIPPTLGLTPGMRLLSLWSLQIDHFGKQYGNIYQGL